MAKNDRKEANSEGARLANTQSNHSANSKRSQQGDVMPETQGRNRFETAGAGGVVLCWVRPH